MTSAYADIARLLRSARRRQAGIAVLAAAGTGAAAALLCLLAGAVAVAFGARLPFRFLALGGAGLALLVALVLAARDLLRRVGGDLAAARTVGAADPRLRSALQSSVELSRARPEIAATGQLSVALVDAHLEHTAARVKGFDLSGVIPDQSARRAGLLLLGVLVLHGVALVAWNGRVARSYVRVLRGAPTGAVAQLDPVTGDIELTFRYPAYMRRDPRTLSGTGGEVHAPKGTEVSLRTRADRVVAAAELWVDLEADASARPAAPAGATAPAPAPTARRYALKVEGGRDLSGGFPVQEGGSYRFRFKDAKGRTLVEGPSIPVVVEPDAYPTAQITAPEKELEVDPGARVEVAWQAEDDVGLGEVSLLLKPPHGEEQRVPLRSAAEPVRRDSGSQVLPLAALSLSEGDQLAYRVEAKDTDTVSGPKAASSDTQFVRIYSEADHRRQMLDRARQAYEELVAMLGDRIDFRGQGALGAEDRLPQAQALDGRTRLTAEHLRQTAREVRRDRAGPREIAQALDNVAQSVRTAAEDVIGDRTRLVFVSRAARESIDASRRVRAREEGRIALAALDRSEGELQRAMEKGVLYLEQLLDKRRAEDLVRLAKNLSQKRRDLADLMERYRRAPTDQAKQELLAQVRRLKEQVKDLLSRMADLSKGFNDEHMNEEALTELAKSQDLMGGLDEVEKKLAQGDVEGAMRSLDQMASAMDQMMAGLSRTAGLPDEKAKELMKEMLAFKDELSKLEQQQKDTAAETDKLRAEYRRRIADQLKNAEAALKRLHELAQSAQRDVAGARPGVTFRAQPEYEGASEAVKDLEQALGMQELEGASDAAKRAEPSLGRLSQYLDQDALSPGLFPEGPQPPQVDDARRRVGQAAPKVREIRDQLSQLFPDPRSVLSKEDQKRLGELSKRQSELEGQAGRLQQLLDALSKKAPIFPPSAQGQLSDSRGHMGSAASELGNRNPQRGHGEQELAMDALSRFKKGLEDAAKGMQQQQGGGQGQGFPFPFAQSEGESQGGDGQDPSREKVKIPGAEAHRVPEAFRKDLLEAMKQGTPERYRPDVQRYYEELVK